VSTLDEVPDIRERAPKRGPSQEARHVIPPRCIANNAYKCWHPSNEGEGLASASRVARSGHLSWLARMRFTLFHRWSEK
jgi:hypothetical protein